MQNEDNLVKEQLLLDWPKVRCKDCAEYFKREEIHIVADGEVCDDCNLYYKECYHCGEYCHEDEVRTTEDNYDLCEGCYDNHAFHCSDCDYTYYDEKTSSHEISGGDNVCGNCFENYSSCNVCGDYYHQDNICYCDECDSNYCDDCGHECPRNDRREPDLTPLIGEKRGKYLKIKRLIGVEIESEDGTFDGLADNLPQACGIEEDGSLDNGIEIVTPPASLDKAEDIIAKSCDTLRAAGWRIKKSCGLHVHVDARDFRSDTKKLSNLLRTVYAVEDIIYSMVPPSRWDSQWCRRLSKEYGFNDFNKPMSVEEFESTWYKTVDKDEIRRNKTNKHDSKGTRYYGINLHSTMYRGTVEFRYHSGSMEPSKILNWAGFLLKIVNYAISRYNDKEIVELYSTPIAELKLRKFFKVFRIEKEAQEYIRERIDRFNPRFELTYATRATQ